MIVNIIFGFLAKMSSLLFSIFRDGNRNKAFIIEKLPGVRSIALLTMNSFSDISKHFDHFFNYLTYKN